MDDILRWSINEKEEEEKKMQKLHYAVNTVHERGEESLLIDTAESNIRSRVCV